MCFTFSKLCCIFENDSGQIKWLRILQNCSNVFCVFKKLYLYTDNQISVVWTNIISTHLVNVRRDKQFVGPIEDDGQCSKKPIWKPLALKLLFPLLKPSPFLTQTQWQRKGRGNISLVIQSNARTICHPLLSFFRLRDSKLR